MSRDFRLVWLGQTASSLGNGVSQLAYPLVMLALTGSPAAAGALAAVRAAPYLVLGLPAGALVDRWDRKRTMVLCDLGRAVNVATVPAALWLGELTPAHLVVTGLVGGVLHVFFSAAENAVLPSVVDEDRLTSAVSATETAQAATGVVAGPVGGALLQLGRGVPFLVDAVSFLVSALCFASVRADLRPEPAERRSLRAEVAEGVRWLWGHRTLRSIALTAAGLQVAISGISLVAIVSAGDASPAAVGGLFAALGAGGVVGALVAPALKDRLGLNGLLLGVVWLHAVLWAALALVDSLVAVGVVLALFTVSMPCFGVAALSHQLEVTPNHLLGRVGTAFSLLIWAATPVGAAAAGLLLDLTTPSATSLAFAAWVVLLGLLVGRAGRRRRADAPRRPVAERG
ncbi:MFS transporter [Saccharothrix xinjiangensis]|uniref:MFS transporter n=1 Tax=Saccharothrix xinjiangensis TaxID=204798 RepID=A0ABV9Y3B7_9PSEU